MQFFCAALPDRTTEHRPHGGAHRLGIIEIGAGIHQQQSVRVKGVCRAQDGTHIAGVLHAVQHHVAPSGQFRGQSLLRHPANAENALRRLGGGNGLHHVCRDLHQPDSGRDGRQRRAFRADHGVQIAAVEQRLLQKLRAVAEEFAVLTAVGGRGTQLAQVGTERICAAGDDLHRCLSFRQFRYKKCAGRYSLL